MKPALKLLLSTTAITTTTTTATPDTATTTSTTTLMLMASPCSQVGPKATLATHFERRILGGVSPCHATRSERLGPRSKSPEFASTGRRRGDVIWGTCALMHIHTTSCGFSRIWQPQLCAPGSKERASARMEMPCRYAHGQSELRRLPDTSRVYHETPKKQEEMAGQIRSPKTFNPNP